MERIILKRKRLQRLIDRGVLAEEELDRVLGGSENSYACPKENIKGKWTAGDIPAAFGTWFTAHGIEQQLVTKSDRHMFSLFFFVPPPPMN
jgi:hypothetical protein